MFNTIGYSVYLSTFEEQKEQLASIYKKGNYVFTSLHLSEEYDPTYTQRVKELCNYLTICGYQIIADVSRDTLKVFKSDSLVDLANMLGISILRIDYGFSENEIIEIAKRYPICINASTADSNLIDKLASYSLDVYAMHNFYPRPETGMDQEQFRMRNGILKNKGFKVLAFIPGDVVKRGPIYEGLPTLESHRNATPYAAFIDLLSYGVDGIFIGDGIISKYQADMISEYLESGNYAIPVLFRERYEYLYNQVYTIRADSPRWLKRLQESREYARMGAEISPEHCMERKTGSITMDNYHYKRYSGEIQIIIETLPADERVNVIGQVSAEYELLLNHIKNGSKVKLIKSLI